MNANGFTLIEVMIVLGILVLIAGFGLFISMDFFRSYSFNYEESLLVSVLQKARSRSMANIGQVAHGVCYNNGGVPNKYILFNSGTSCATSTENVDLNSSVTPNSFSVIFNQLDGTATPTTITLTGQGKTATITINSLGAILY